MKSYSQIKSGMRVAAVCGIVVAAGLLTFRAQADEWDKKTILTIDQPIQVTNTYLEPGTYVFKLANSSSDRHIVQIFTGDQKHIIDTIMAIPNYRLQPTGSSRFAFWETPPGSARALRAWFYPGDNFGQEFRYPKHLRELAVVTPPPAPVPVAPAPEPQVAPAPEPQPAPQAFNEEPRQAEPPAEIAQNNAPAPPPPAQEAPPAPTPAAEPQVLPKTASPYPMIGLGGLLALGLSTLLRIKRFV
jgi:hypothetical protein